MYSCSRRKSRRQIPDRWSVEGKLKMEIPVEASLSASHRLRGGASSLTNHMGSPSREGLCITRTSEAKKLTPLSEEST